MDIIGGRCFQSSVGGQVIQGAVEKPASREEILLHFDKEVFPAENISKCLGRFLSQAVMTLQDKLWNPAFAAS